MPYFKEIFDYARTLDPQHRPLTYTNLLMAAGGKDKCHQFADVICLNRYYGWYVQDGYQLIGAKKTFIDEMNQWMKTESNKPFLFTEYGADTDAGVHKLPSVQWSEEYQCEYTCARLRAARYAPARARGQSTHHRRPSRPPSRYAPP